MFGPRTTTVVSAALGAVLGTAGVGAWAMAGGSALLPSAAGEQRPAVPQSQSAPYATDQAEPTRPDGDQSHGWVSDRRPDSRSRPVAQSTPTLTPTPTRTRESTTSPTRTPDSTPTVAVSPVLLGRGDSGIDVRELQARLLSIGWGTGPVDGRYGDATVDAVTGFQGKRGFPRTGEVDKLTWDTLLEMTVAPTQTVLFPGRPAAAVPDPEAPPQPDAADSPVLGPHSVLDPRCLTGRVLCIDKTTQRLRLVVDGDVHSAIDVRFGAEGTPTREGEFAVFLKDVDHVSSLFGSSMPYSMFFDGGQAVHYSPEFADVGYEGGSHGCVNTRDMETTAEIFERVQVGDPVIVYWS